ncbi:MAG: nicotinamide mononucleotide transporter [Chromatiales bacterium]|nr:nicotinamide mononucleotide transporter [Chromatiales bacterium]
MEAAAVVLAIEYLVLAIRENRWCWPAGIASALLYGGVFHGAGLYMQAWLQLFYVAMGAYGWWAWRPGTDGDATLAIQRRPLRWHGAALAAIVLISLASGGLLERYTAAESPYLDSFVTWSAVLTTWMVARKLLENWLYWFVIDAVTLGLALERGLYPTAALFALYLVLVVQGWRRWLAAWARHPAAAA